MNNRRYAALILSTVSLVLVLSGWSFGKAFSAFEGTIQGANCVINETRCPTTNMDPHLALENEFVLLTEGGEYYFLPNLHRSLKTQYVNRDVKVMGEMKDHSIIVNNLMVKENGNYASVWNWPELVKGLEHVK